MTSDRSTKFANIALALAALVIAGVVLVRQFAPSSPSAPVASVTRIENWEALRDSVAISVESPARLQQLANASISKTEDGPRTSIKPYIIDITTFTDFECPFCRQADSVINGIASQYIVTRNVIHYPLPEIHRQALPAARALECADREGQASVMHRVLYRNQAHLGVTPWSKIGELAEVEDTTAFLQCLESKPDERIKAGQALGRRLKIAGTPTVIINGWLINPSTPARINEVFTAILKRQTPR